MPSIAPLLVSFSTTSLPNALAIKKQSAAPAIADDHDKRAPFTQPNIDAFANVIKNAGIGAATDCKIISINDITAAILPYDLIYSITA